MGGRRLLPTFAGWRPRDLAPDVLAGLTLAAIAIPEQMATARLAGAPPELGFLALVAGGVGFALAGASRRLSVGADSTIAPIFAGGLALAAPAAGAPYLGELALLALLVGLALIVAGALRLGFVADLLSIPGDDRLSRRGGGSYRRQPGAGFDWACPRPRARRRRDCGRSPAKSAPPIRCRSASASR